MKPIFFFDQNERVKTISLELLEQSKLVTDVYGNPVRTKPVQSWELINIIKRALDDRNIPYTQSPIYVQRSSSLRILTEEEKKSFSADNTPIDKWLFNKIITRFVIKEGNKDTQGAIAASFHDHGINVAFGLDVTMYGNLCIFTHKDNIRSYGERKESFENILTQLNEWLDNYKEHITEKIEITKRFNAIRFTKSYLDEIIVDLYVQAINQNYDNRKQAPFNQEGVSNFVQSILKEYNAIPDEFYLWDIYNLGTNIINPQNVDIKDIIDNNTLFTEYLIEKYINC